jgi:hypothetical protein
MASLKDQQGITKYFVVAVVIIVSEVERLHNLGATQPYEGKISSCISG